MSQHVEIFFANPPENSVEAVLMPKSDTEGPTARQIAFAYRLVGRYAVMNEELCEEWSAVLISSPEFIQANRARAATDRPKGTRLCFLATHGTL